VATAWSWNAFLVCLAARITLIIPTLISVPARCAMCARDRQPLEELDRVEQAHGRPPKSPNALNEAERRIPAQPQPVRCAHRRRARISGWPFDFSLLPARARPPARLDGDMPPPAVDCAGDPPGRDADPLRLGRRRCNMIRDFESQSASTGRP
jgi:hypothetical protein